MGWGIEVLDLGEPTSSTGRTAPPIPGEPLPQATPDNPNPIHFQIVRALRQAWLENKKKQKIWKTMNYSLVIQR